MHIFNLDSPYSITKDQESFADSLLYFGSDRPVFDDNQLFSRAEVIPIFLVSARAMPGNPEPAGERPSTEFLGFYQHSSKVLGVPTPLIGVCPERTLDVANDDEQLTALVAMVIIHELAHAIMMPPGDECQPIDEFYDWIEEPMANAVTLSYFWTANMAHCHQRHQSHPRSLSVPRSTSINPLRYIESFISAQPPNYSFGLDLFKQRILWWWNWRHYKEHCQRKANEEQMWLEYAKAHVGSSDQDELERLFRDLTKST